MIYLIGILSTVAWIWLIIIAIKENQFIWGIAMILFMPLSLLYGILNWSKSNVPFILLLVSIGLLFTLSPEQVQQLKQS